MVSVRSYCGKRIQFPLNKYVSTAQDIREIIEAISTVWTAVSEAKEGISSVKINGKLVEWPPSIENIDKVLKEQ